MDMKDSVKVVIGGNFKSNMKMSREIGRDIWIGDKEVIIVEAYLVGKNWGCV